MTLRAVAQVQSDSQEDFIRKVILWYRNERKLGVHENTQHYGGNRHIGVSKEELELPFIRHFNVPHSALVGTIDTMIEKGTLIVASRWYEFRGEPNYRRKAAMVRMIRKLPGPRQRVRGRLRFYLPDALPREVKTGYNKELKADRVIREILHPTPTTAA